MLKTIYYSLHKKNEQEYQDIKQNCVHQQNCKEIDTTNCKILIINLNWPHRNYTFVWPIVYEKQN